MHEFPITQQIIKIASEAAQKNNSEKVEKIILVVGDYSGYISDSIQMYFDIIAEGTHCEGATLNIIRIKPKLKCDFCQQLFERKPYSFDCPKCNGPGSPTQIGKEFYIKEIVIK